MKANTMLHMYHSPKLSRAITVACAILALAELHCLAADSRPSAEELRRAAAVNKTWIRASESRQDFAVFTSPTQQLDVVFTGGVRAAVRAVPGSVISTDGGRPILHSGTIRIDGSKGNATITARAMTTTVEAPGSAIIESVPSMNSFRVINVGNGVVLVRTRGARTVSQLKPNEQLVIANIDKQTKPFDAATENSDAKLLLDANAGNTGDPIRLKSIAATEFKCDSQGAISLRHGQSLVECTDGAVVSGSVASVLAKKSAIIDVECYEGDMRVKALSGPGHVSLSVGSQTMPIQPGQEAFVCRRSVEDKDMTPPDGVGRRRSETIKWADGVNVVLSDFSIPTFLNGSEHMQSIRRSGQVDDRGLWERMLKTAAAIQIISTRSGPYKSVARSARPHRPTRPAGTSL